MDLEHIHILLADDDKDDCCFFEEALGELPLRTQLNAVHNGEQLMGYLGNELNKLPDILYLDLNMPRKNGLECLAEIKLDLNLCSLPIIMFSTSFEQGVVDTLHESGAKYFIRKPPTFAEFRMIILASLLLVANGNEGETAKEDFVIKIHNPARVEEEALLATNTN